MHDGRVRHVHANKIRKFHVRIQSCNVISECDDDFGRVLTPVTESSKVLPSECFDREKIEHLESEHQCELLQLLDDFADCFSSKPGCCTIVEHRIQVTSGFQPGRMGPCRVPEVMRADVGCQMGELLDSGMIIRSSSPMASPLVCVARKRGSVGLACGFGYVGSFTVPGPFALVTDSRVCCGLCMFLVCFHSCETCCEFWFGIMCT